jgi:hypothetical protein
MRASSIIGRSVTVCHVAPQVHFRGENMYRVKWCGKSGALPGELLRPCAGFESSSLELQATTVAELLRAAGYFVEEIAPETSARDHEVKLESAFFDLQLSRYQSMRQPEDSAWSFVVSDPADAEQAFIFFRVFAISCSQS